jgi:O-acetylserine/cysteine efflux transporter
MQAWTAVACIPPLLLLSLLLEGDPRPTVAAAPWLPWTGVLYSALIASVGGHALMFFLVQRHPVATVTPYFLLTPLFATALGVMVWGDRPGGKLWVGGALVLSGVLAVSLRRKVVATRFDA